MIWLAWRQYRAQAVTAVAAFIALGIVLAYTGPHLAHLYNASGIAACQAGHGDCGPLIDDFTSHYPFLHGLGVLIVIVPGVLGVFWGAPLIARDVETRTHQLAWTQSVTRTRWLATKVALIGAASLALVGALTVVIALWSSPIDHVSGSRLGPGRFDQRGIVPLAYAAFAFAFGVLAGALIRRTIPAMVATLGGFAAVRFVVQQFVRPHLATPFHVTAPIFGGGGAATVPPGAWVVTGRTVDAAGHAFHVNRASLRAACQIQQGGFEFGRTALRACAQRLGIHDVLTVQAARNYWPFQAWEAGMFAVLAVASLAAAFWWTRRRIV
ncbi:MAG: hypothetical protein ACYDH6_04505 [Acidimicrobiales bacterium]